MDASILMFARTVQLGLLALLVVITLVQGIRIAFMGAKGFGDALVGVGALLGAVFFVARPNAVLSLLTTAVGGVQTPTLPS